MKEVTAGAAAVTIPSFGPAAIVLFGREVSVLALCLSVAALLLARFIGPPPSRHLTQTQHIALTALLLIVQFGMVSGAFTGAPMSEGPAVALAIGLGLSGLLAVEFFGERALALLRAAFGKADHDQG